MPPSGRATHDHARDACAFFNEGHDAVDRKRRDDVQRGHRQIDLDAARGFFLRLHGEHGEFGHRHGKRHGRVLEDVHRLAGQRRNDDAKRHGQQHIAVGLEGGETHGHAGISLAAWQGLNARAHLLGNTCRGEKAQRQHHQRKTGHAPQHREQAGQHVVPEENLDQQRNIAKQLDPGIAQANDHRAVLQGAQRTDE